MGRRTGSQNKKVRVIFCKDCGIEVQTTASYRLYCDVCERARWNAAKNASNRRRAAEVKEGRTASAPTESAALTWYEERGPIFPDWHTHPRAMRG